MIFHILNGDSLAHTFAQSNIPGELIICREALIDGPVQANSLDTFWGIRASYIAQTYGEQRDRYYQNVVSEMDKMLRLPKDAEILPLVRRRLVLPNEHVVFALATR
ncbi:MAG: hypothetical protein IPO07_06440 [Haliscomenobacter sp.]|nr:hypothetical protein [Haliscomenobacter sp.]MBK9488450.1 hypothetical protein [Haliscomenobacter sp.]